jgi:hypothetical protein
MKELNTNKIASPVKFAEYLTCGLNIIISNNLGVYTDFTLKKLRLFGIKFHE